MGQQIIQAEAPVRHTSDIWHDILPAFCYQGNQKHEKKSIYTKGNKRDNIHSP